MEPDHPQIEATAAIENEFQQYVFETARYSKPHYPVPKCIWSAAPHSEVGPVNRAATVRQLRLGSFAIGAQQNSNDSRF